MEQSTKDRILSETSESVKQKVRENANKLVKPKQETTLEEVAKFIVFTHQDSEDWTQHSVPLDSFEKADNFAQQFRDKKRSYLICKTIKQGYNGK